MSKSIPSPTPASPIRIPIAGILTWILPGLGHLFCGDRSRGWILMVTIGATFWGGVAIGGVRHTVDPARRKLWFMAQICGGGHAIAAFGVGEWSRKRLIESKFPATRTSNLDKRNQMILENQALATSRWKATEVSWVYTGVAGLLNILAILDVLARSDPESVRRAAAAATTVSEAGARISGGAAS